MDVLGWTKPPEVCYERIKKSVTVNSLQHIKINSNKGFRNTKKVKDKTRHSFVTEENLSRKMNIGLEKAKQMMRATTKKSIQTAVNPITRKYRVYQLDPHTIRWAEK